MTAHERGVNRCTGGVEWGAVGGGSGGAGHLQLETNQLLTPEYLRPQACRSQRRHTLLTLCGGGAVGGVGGWLTKCHLNNNKTKTSNCDRHIDSSCLGRRDRNVVLLHGDSD